MATDDGPKWWEFLDNHLENLIPGCLMLALLLYAVPATKAAFFVEGESNPFLRDSPYVGAAVFFSAAYMLGVCSFVVGRFLLLYLPSSVCPSFRRWRDGDALRGKTEEEIYRFHRRVIKAATQSETMEIRKEVEKRRQRVRLLRAAFAPACLVGFIGAGGWWGGFGLAFLIYVLFAGVVFYDELCVYQEATRALPRGFVTEFDFRLFTKDVGTLEPGDAQREGTK